MTESDTIEQVRSRLTEVAARTTQDIGLGRIVGQVMGYVYLAEKDCSLDDIAEKLGLSKAAVSIAARRLESLELLKRVWRQGDRRSYYRTVDNFRVALQRGLMAMVTAKIRTIGEELDTADSMLKGVRNVDREGELKFLKSRVDRARKMKDRAVRILDNPVVRFLGK